MVARMDVANGLLAVIKRAIRRRSSLKAVTPGRANRSMRRSALTPHSLIFLEGVHLDASVLPPQESAM